MPNQLGHQTSFIPQGNEWVSRCDLCGKPFIYGHAKTNDMGQVILDTFVKGDDAGEKRGRTWAHRRCFEARDRE